jgi:hypothetical protein
MMPCANLSKEEVVGRNFFNFLDEENREIIREPLLDERLAP